MHVYDTQHRLLTLDSEMARGGEGAIHRVQGKPELLAKIYFPPPADQKKKLSAMIARPPVDPMIAQGHISIAWPKELLFGDNGQFVGFLMPYARHTTKLLTVYNPTLRAKELPNFNLLYRHRAARNLAVALRAIHQEGYVVGDINESNILVADTALITFIDTDSFQVQVQHQSKTQTFPCPVGKPEYIPPELQGKPLRQIIRYPQHDHFGLGVLIFQLLMDGNHPFRGNWLGDGEALPLEERIAEGLFPYGAGQGKIVPRRGLSLDVLHPEVQRLVERCFIDGHRNPRQRPNPDDWESALEKAETALKKCPNGHYYSNHQRVCPACGTQTVTVQKALPPAQPTSATTKPVVPTQTPSKVSSTPVASAQPRSTVQPPSPPVGAKQEYNWGLIFWWIVASIAGVFPSLIIGDTLYRVVSGVWIIIFNDRDIIPYINIFFLDIIGALTGVIVGTIIGIPQWLVLRRHVPEAGWWVSLTALGYGIGYIAGGFAMKWGIGEWEALAVGGMVIGIAQWLVLRQHTTQAGWWIPATAAGFALLPVAPLGNYPNLMPGVVIGAIPAITLAQLLRAQYRSVLPNPVTAQSGRRRSLMFWWIVASIVGVFVGDNIGNRGTDAFLLNAPVELYIQDILILPHNDIYWAIVGIAMGISQRIVLRRHTIQVGGWILLTALGYGIGPVIERFVMDWDNVEWTSIAVRGITVGVAQWLALRQYTTHAGWWIPATAVGFALVPIASSYVGVSYPEPWFFVTWGAVIGGIPAITLAWLLRT